jgi:hypothetical protein
MRLRPALALAAVLLLPACGLPLPEGVQSAGQVRPQPAEAPVVEVVPPGPATGASAEQMLRDFLNAQRTPDDDHAVARQFLAPGTEWDDEAGALVYDFDSRRFAQDPGDPTSIVVRFRTVGSISADGSYSLESGPGSRAYRLARQPDGQYRLDDVPDGLFLTTGDVGRSFRPYDVYFLGRDAGGEATAQLVPDRAFLPVTAEPATALVRRLLDGPSAALGRAVDTAAPAAAAARVSVVEGVVTVDLGPEADALGARERQRLSAQLVWTLVPAGFTGLRLLADGQPLDVPGAGEVQDRTDWEEYDPTRTRGGDPPLHYVQNRVLRTLGGEPLPDSPVTRPGDLPVDEVAASPVAGQLAVVTRRPDGDLLSVGPRGGPFAAALAKPRLRSPTWGPGTQGVWVLEPGPRPILWLVRVGAPPQPVAYPQPPGAGPLSTLRVSRDGARIALVFGSEAQRRLYVARVEPAGGRFEVTGAQLVAPELAGVADVAWLSGTSLVVLAAAATGDAQLVLSTVPVDGSTGPIPVQRQGLSGALRSLAATPGQPLVVAAELDGRRVLFRDNGALFRQQDQLLGATEPTYPG